MPSTDARECVQYARCCHHEKAGQPVNARSARPHAGADRYHHGNLRQTLLEHAVELARAGGPDAVVLRDVQRRAGVSNSAAYRHYADRDALLAAVTTYAEARLADTMMASLRSVPDPGSRARRATARLRAAGQAYVDFALAEPGLFRTAFAPDPARPDHVTHASLVQRGSDLGSLTAPPTAADGLVGQDHPFQILIRCIDDLVAAGVLASDRREGLDAAAWAAVHGLATLFLDGPLRALDSAQKQLVTDRLHDVFQQGLK
jgi:AcrR family transcriptional regulator